MCVLLVVIPGVSSGVIPGVMRFMRGWREWKQQQGGNKQGHNPSNVQWLLNDTDPPLGHSLPLSSSASHHNHSFLPGFHNQHVDFQQLCTFMNRNFTLLSSKHPTLSPSIPPISSPNSRNPAENTHKSTLGLCVSLNLSHFLLFFCSKTLVSSSLWNLASFKAAFSNKNKTSAKLKFSRFFEKQKQKIGAKSEI